MFDYDDAISKLKNKKIGTTKELYFDRSKFDSIKDYDSYDELVRDVQTRKLDAIVLNDGQANKTQTLTEDLSRIENEAEVIQHAFGFQKGNTELLNPFNDMLKDTSFIEGERKKWKSVNYQTSIDEDLKNLPGGKGTINALFRLKNQPYAYRLSNKDPTGLEISLLYNFAKRNDYKVNLKEADTYKDLIESLKNKSADIVGGLLPIKDDYKEEISYSDISHNSTNYVVVRYENLKESLTWYDFYESPDELNGEVLGVLKNSNLKDLTKEKFPKSTENVEIETVPALFGALVTDKIEGFLMDETNIAPYKLIFPDRITYFPDSYYDNNYGFAFQKNNEKGNKLKTEFNKYLKSIDFKELYNKWNVQKTSDLTIDKDLDKDAELINAAFLPDVKPLCFQENGEMKGAEIELLYKFAKEKNYNIKLTPLNEIDERISYIEDGKADITGGYLTITDERKKKVDFSDSYFTAKTVMVVRKDSKKDEIAMTVLDDKYNPKANNAADILVKFPKRETYSSCVFPKKYSDIITIDCTISDLKDIDPYNEGFEYVNSSDKINITYSKLDVGNFINANKKISGHKIINESDKSSKVCNGTKPSPSPDDGNGTIYYPRKKKSSGLSTGGIIGIMIPCGLALLGAAGFALMGSRPAPLPQYNPSELQTVSRQNLPLNAYDIQQPVQVVQPVQAAQPVQVVQNVNAVP